MARRNTKDRAETRRRRWWPRPAYLILLACMALFAFKFIERTQEIKQLTVQENALQAQNAGIWADNQRMRRAIAYYQTPAFIQEDARALMGYTMPGDTAIRVRPPLQVRAPLAVAVNRHIVASAPNWQQWWQSFFG